MKVILASQSERRRHLLKKIFDRFDVIIPDVQEIIDDSRSPEEIAVFNAWIKAKSTGDRIEDKNCLIISADTIVVVKNRILGKPEDFDTAFEYLKLLSGTFHRVITGCCLYNPSVNKILKDFDIIHFSFNVKEKTIKKPFICTIHGNGLLGEVFNRNSVFLSKNHAQRHNADVFVYNGIFFVKLNIF